jgi:hypothetical protein
MLLRWLLSVLGVVGVISFALHNMWVNSQPDVPYKPCFPFNVANPGRPVPSKFQGWYYPPSTPPAGRSPATVTFAAGTKEGDFPGYMITQMRAQPDFDWKFFRYPVVDYKGGTVPIPHPGVWAYAYSYWPHGQKDGLDNSTYVDGGLSAPDWTQ